MEIDEKSLKDDIRKLQKENRYLKDQVEKAKDINNKEDTLVIIDCEKKSEWIFSGNRKRSY